MPSCVKIVDSIATLKNMLDKLVAAAFKSAPLAPPPLYVDVEGVKLSRSGSVTLISIYSLPDDTAYLVDVYQLGRDAFHTRNREEYSLKCILEFPGVPKVFFDVRNDSDALFHLYGISLGGVQDLQLMELASKSAPTMRVSSLARCVERDLSVSDKAKAKWLKCKEEGRKLFNPKESGSYDVFIKRPLHQTMIAYCSQDVTILPSLWKTYAASICGPDSTGFWRSMIRKASIERVEMSQTKGYDSQSSDRTSSPWDAGYIEDCLEDWNGDVMLLGVHDNATLKELSFGIFLWV